MANDDLFDDARTGWLKTEDLVGRLLLIKAIEIGERESTMAGSNGKMYEYVVGDMVILDGETTELIEAIPHREEAFQFAGARLVSTLKPKIRTGRMALGRFAQVPVKGRAPAWELQPPNDKDRALATKYLTMVADDLFS